MRQEDLLDDYQTISNSWLEKAIIERVPARSRPRLLFSTQVVKKEGTKIRPVFDASAKVKESPLLNQCLETGPNLIKLIPALLHRFRERKIGVTADIAKTFLQISVSRIEMF